MNNAIFITNDSKRISKVNIFGHVEKLVNYPNVYEKAKGSFS